MLKFIWYTRFKIPGTKIINSENRLVCVPNPYTRILFIFYWSFVVGYCYKSPNTPLHVDWLIQFFSINVFVNRGRCSFCEWGWEAVNQLPGGWGAWCHLSLLENFHPTGILQHFLCLPGQLFFCVFFRQFWSSWEV